MSTHQREAYDKDCVLSKEMYYVGQYNNTFVARSIYYIVNHPKKRMFTSTHESKLNLPKKPYNVGHIV